MGNVSRIIRNVVIAAVVFLVLAIWGIVSMFTWVMDSISEPEGTPSHVEQMEDIFFNENESDEYTVNGKGFGN